MVSVIQNGYNVCGDLPGSPGTTVSMATGLTTRQMETAPQGAVFVWCNGHLDYPQALARKVGRDDLEIVSPTVFESNYFLGRNLTGLVIDHAARLTDRQIDFLRSRLE